MFLVGLTSVGVVTDGQQDSGFCAFLDDLVALAVTGGVVPVVVISATDRSRARPNIISGSWAPHHGPQARLMVGTNAFEFTGKSYSGAGDHPTSVNDGGVSERSQQLLYRSGALRHHRRA